MSQNVSTAVMQRRVAGTNGLDFYPTPPWGTRALMEHILQGECDLNKQTVWEPAAGHGDMSRPLADYFGRVITTDIHDHGKIEHHQHDFLMPYLPKIEGIEDVSWVVTNPPFRLAEQFIKRSMELPKWRGTAMLVRSAFLEGIGRYNRLYDLQRPAIIAQFTERLVMHHGKLSATGSTATAYCWLVWLKGCDVSTFEWIPPCRKTLEKAGDYEC